MNSRERVLAAINHQPVDRIPTDLWATGEVMEKLCKQFGSNEAALEALHVDGIAGVWPNYTGPPLPEMPDGETIDYWGIRSRRVVYETGTYYEMYRNPLQDMTTIDDLEQYQWPSADWFDYSQLRDQALKAREKQAVMGGYMTPFYLHNLLRGLEQSLMDPLVDEEFTHYLLKRADEYIYAFHLRMFETCEGLIDTAQVTDDYGSQSGPLISLDTFREFYKPYVKRYCDLCHGFGIKVFHHDDGAMSSFIPDLLECGIDILNPIQWVCPGMEQEGLKSNYGDRLCFHGGIDNQRILPFGAPEEVRAEVRHNIDTLASDGTGYILAPCHNLQAVSPVENIIAMYDEAYNYGRF